METLSKPKLRPLNIRWKRLLTSLRPTVSFYTSALMHFLAYSTSFRFWAVPESTLLLPPLIQSTMPAQMLLLLRKSLK
jgi:hypothetical protein